MSTNHKRIKIGLTPGNIGKRNIFDLMEGKDVQPFGKGTPIRKAEEAKSLKKIQTAKERAVLKKRTAKEIKNDF